MLFRSVVHTIINRADKKVNLDGIRAILGAVVDDADMYLLHCDKCNTKIYAAFDSFSKPLPYFGKKKQCIQQTSHLMSREEYSIAKQFYTYAAKYI